MNKSKILRKFREAKTIKKDFFVFDTETVIKNGKKAKYELRGRPENFYFGVVMGWNYMKVIKNLEEFHTEFLHPRYKGKKVFAHNAEYDLNTLYDNIYKFDPTAIFNGKFICATNGNAIFADSMNIYQTSVKKIGEVLGLEKMELNEGDLNNWFDCSTIPEKDIKYCIRDCEIIYEALLRAFEFAGEIKITQAALSMSYFRRYHLPYNIQHDDKTQKNFYNSYFGGRTEVFKLGATHSHVYDINSSYPYVMKNIDFPNPKFMQYRLDCSPQKLVNNLLFTTEGCAHVRIKHKKTWLGYLPFKRKVKNTVKLIFPANCYFEGWYNFNELRYAIENDIIEITNVFKVVFSERMESIFKSFVDTCYYKRFEVDNDFEAYRYKVYSNSLYGKFAQRIDTNHIYIESVYDQMDEIEEHQRKGTFIKLLMFNQVREDAFLVVKNITQISISYSIPSFASYITSGARVNLLDKLIKSEYKIPVYCDTDSIFLEHELPYENHIDGNGIPILGAWKKENKIVTQINGLKNYRYHTIDKSGMKSDLLRRLKGVPNKAIEIRPNVFEYESLMKSKEALRRGLLSGVKTLRTKIISNSYDKRIVDTDGNTKPIEL